MLDLFLIKVNGVPVIGWNQTNLEKKINGEAQSQINQSINYELLLLLSKKPRENWSSMASTLLSSSKPKTLFNDVRSSDQKKIILDFKLKIQPDLLNRSQNLVFFFNF